jgi:arylsulfatase A-like enzyme
MNTQHFKGEDDYFCARTATAAMEWLDMNATNSPFMLWIEMFDPHEPWDPPPRFAKMVRDDYGYDRFLFGYGVQGGAIKPDFTPHLSVIRDLYRAEVTFTDHCIGRLLEKLEQMKLLDETIVVFTSDHGTHLGELGYVQKQAALLNSLVMHVPLMIRHPDRSTAGKRVSALTSTIDYAPTFCSLLGIDDQDHMDGKNLWPLVEGRSDSLHERTFTQFGNFASVRNDSWHYFQHLSGNNVGAGPCLYDLNADPDETQNVAEAHPDQVQQLRERIAERVGHKLPEPAAAGA